MHFPEVKHYLFLALASMPSLAQSVDVNSANPNSAAQGTISLSVSIGGRGFKNGAKSQFLVSGTTDNGGITVTSTSFVSSTQLTANISVSTAATISSFDIVVTNADGRSGKGTGLFSVNANTNQAVVTFSDATTNQVKSDGLGSFYNGVNEASTTFVKNGNVVLDLGSSTRTVCLDFSQPDTALNAGLGAPDLTGCYNAYVANNVESGTPASCSSGTGLLGMIVGQSANSCFWVNFTDSSGASWALRFAHPNYPYTTDAMVTRLDGHTWTLTTNSTSVAVLFLNTKRGSTIEGYYYMGVQLTVAQQ